MNILATKAVFEGSPINILHKENDTWFLLSKEELEKEIKFGDDTFSSVDEEFIYERIPKLRGKLNQEDKTTINIDYSTGEININPQHFHLGIPTHDAKATRQANAGFSFIHYMITTRSRYKKPLFYLISLLLAALWIGWFFYIPLALYFILKVLELLKTRDMYYSGALNPAIVIDEKTSKIASLTDMTLGFGEYPLIRIRNYPLPKKYKKNHTRIPVAGTYQNTGDYNHWNFYEPNPIPSGVKDENIIISKLNAIPSDEWTKLLKEIKKFDGIPKEGYYPIDVENSSWKDVNLDEINWMQFGEEK